MVVKILVVLIGLISATTSFAAEYEVQPSLIVSEEYTDNVFDTNKKESDFITRAMPKIIMAIKSPVLTGDLSYQLDYRYYAHRSYDDEITHVAAAKGVLTAVENLFFIDLKEEFRRVSLDVSRDVTRESLTANQSDRNVAIISPYLVLQPGKTTTVKAGYSFIDTRYFDSAGVDKVDHHAYAEVNHDFSATFKGVLGYRFIRENADVSGYDQHQAYAGFNYEYADKSFLSLQGGGIWTEFDDRNSQNSPYWKGSLSYYLNNVTTTLSSEVRYAEDPLGTSSKETISSLNIERALVKGSVVLGGDYSEFAIIDSGKVATRRTTGRARWNNEITSALNGSVAVFVERYEYPLLNTNTRRILIDSSVSYLFAEKATIALNYIFADYSSPGIVADNRQVNRVVLEIRKSF